jgi:hypothetical protein
MQSGDPIVKHLKQTDENNKYEELEGEERL